jgi:YHS domain-containing protein
MTQPLNIPDQGLLTVCGGKMKNPQDFPNALFHGRRVYFCTLACLRAFESDPERFMAGEIEHPDGEEITVEK